MIVTFTSFVLQQVGSGDREVAYHYDWQWRWQQRVLNATTCTLVLDIHGCCNEEADAFRLIFLGQRQQRNPKD